MTTNGYRRRTFIINRPFQTKMIIASLLISIPQMILFYASFYFFMQGLRDQLDFTDKILSLPLREFVENADLKMTTVVLVGSFLIILSNIVVFVFLSHAIAGPIEKLKSHLTKKSLGEATGPFFVRKSDYFTELPDYINKAFKDETIDNEPNPDRN
jgi:hypothetical protein